MVGDISEDTGKAKRKTKRVPKTKVWKLKRQMEEYNKAIKEYSPTELQDDKTVDEIWVEMSRVLYVTGLDVCGETKGGCPRKYETCWWDKEVQSALNNKMKAYKTIKEGSVDL